MTMRPNCFCKIDKKLILAQPKINLRSSKNTLDYQEQWFEAFERKRGAPAWKKKLFRLFFFAKCCIGPLKLLKGL